MKWTVHCLWSNICRRIKIYVKLYDVLICLYYRRYCTLAHLLPPSKFSFFQKLDCGFVFFLSQIHLGDFSEFKMFKYSFKKAKPRQVFPNVKHVLMLSKIHVFIKNKYIIRCATHFNQISYSEKYRCRTQNFCFNV